MTYALEKRRLLLLAGFWSAPLWWAVGHSSRRDIVRSEIARWVDCLGNPALEPLDERARFAYLAGALPEFRYVVHLRIADLPAPLRLLLRAVYRPLPGLVVQAPTIGPGLFIHHGHGTMVVAESIGANFWVNQHVSLGHSRHGVPVVGDDVTVTAGAVVIGPITLGDGCTIGPNAVVTSDVAPGTTLVAPPAVPLTPREATEARR
ncbi:MAG: hypothetical protein ABWX74_06910 [Aeromicrobium sp.]